jgi:hypothetical protein
MTQKVVGEDGSFIDIDQVIAAAPVPASVTAAIAAAVAAGLASVPELVVSASFMGGGGGPAVLGVLGIVAGDITRIAAGQYRIALPAAVAAGLLAGTYAMDVAPFGGGGAAQNAMLDGGVLGAGNLDVYLTSFTIAAPSNAAATDGSGCTVNIFRL